MAEETRWCGICKKEKPNDAFRTSEGSGKDFTKCVSLAAQSTEMCVYHMPRWAKEYARV